MQIKNFLFADYATQDKFGKYSLIGVFDTFYIDLNRDTSVNFVIYFTATGTRHTTQVQINIKNPGGENIAQVPLNTDAPTDTDKINVAAIVNNMSLSQYGRHEIEILVNGTKISNVNEHYLEVSTQN